MTLAKINELGGSCDCPEQMIAPISRITYVDIGAELIAIPKITAAADHLNATKKMLCYWGRLPLVEEEIWKPKIKKARNYSDKNKSAHR